MRMKYDVFICHASEDKDYVEPLALELQRRGLSVWYDDFILKIGDSLSESIERGLRESSYGVVVISPDFFRKRWPRKELGALHAREAASQTTILPIWHNMTAAQVREQSPMLADTFAAKSSEGIETVVTRIVEVANPELLRQKASALDRFADLNTVVRVYLSKNLAAAELSGADITPLVASAQESLAAMAKAMAEVGTAVTVEEVLQALDAAERAVAVALMYCVKCRSKVHAEVVRVTMKNGKPALKAKCPNCGTTMFKIGAA
jgi:RNase P subunit RPR2